MAIINSIRNLEELGTGTGSFSQPPGASIAAPAPNPAPPPSPPSQAGGVQSVQTAVSGPSVNAAIGPGRIDDSMGSAAAPTLPATSSIVGTAQQFPSMSGGNQYTINMQGGTPSGASFTAPPPDPTAINPKLGTVTDDELVARQLAKITGENSPLIQRAKAAAMAEAANRGLRNSTMAAQAGQAAVLDAAMPIATADAATFNRQALTNQDASNQFLSQDKSLQGQRLLAGEERTFQGSENQKNRDSQASIAQMNIIASQQEAGARLQLGYAELASRGKEFDAQIAQQLRLAGMEDSRIRELTTMEIDSRNASNLAGLQQSTLNNYTNTLMSIYGSNMEPEARANALRNISSIYRGNPYLPITINLEAFPPAGTPASQGGIGGSSGTTNGTEG